MASDKQEIGTCYCECYARYFSIPIKLIVNPAVSGLTEMWAEHGTPFQLNVNLAVLGWNEILNGRPITRKTSYLDTPFQLNVNLAALGWNEILNGRPIT